MHREAERRDPECYQQKPFIEIVGDRTMETYPETDGFRGADTAYWKLSVPWASRTRGPQNKEPRGGGVRDKSQGVLVRFIDR